VPVVARYDHALAKDLVAEAQRSPQPGNFGMSNYFASAAIADPRGAVTLVEKLPDGPEKDYARQRVADRLLAEGDAVWRAVHRDLAQWYVDDEDL
jgi:hypothetical protein